MNKDLQEEIKGLLKKFYSILENDVPAFKDELQPRIEKILKEI